MSRTYTNKRVEIHWTDARGVSSEWEFLDELEPFTPVKIVSVGFLFEDNVDYKTICQSFGGESKEAVLTGLMTIPVSSIEKMVVLKG